jgi:hypothetical protein
MVTHAFTAAGRRVHGPRQVTHLGVRACDCHATGLRLLVVGTTTADVVRYAGGWLFDRTTAGWDAAAVTTAPACTRALRILGATAGDLDRELESAHRIPTAIAVEASLYGTDHRVQFMITSALAAGHTDVRLWGGRDGDCAPLPHRLSLAARAFKAHAMAAATGGPPHAVDAVESFWTP